MCFVVVCLIVVEHMLCDRVRVWCVCLLGSVLLFVCKLFGVLCVLLRCVCVVVVVSLLRVCVVACVFVCVGLDVCAFCETCSNYATVVGLFVGVFVVCV